MRNLWIVALIFSVILLITCLLPPIELYLGIDVPFIMIDQENFNVYGFDVKDSEQIGVMLGCGVIGMLPARLIPLAILKLEKRNS